jgi:hypothetical protein
LRVEIASSDTALPLDACLRATISQNASHDFCIPVYESLLFLVTSPHLFVRQPSATLLVPRLFSGTAMVMHSISSAAAGPVQPSLPADDVDFWLIPLSLRNTSASPPCLRYHLFTRRYPVSFSDPAKSSAVS